MTETTRDELVKQADALRREARHMDQQDPATHDRIRQARDLYRQAGLNGFANWCERFLKYED